MAEAVRIMCFSWNTESVRLCETLDPEVKTAHRRGNIFGQYTPGGWLECEHPDFFRYMKTEIDVRQPDVVFVGFQEDAYPGSYFHSHFLPEEMGKIGYTLLKRTTLKGVGKTSADALMQGKILTRGLRSSVYVKTGFNDRLVMSETYLKQTLPDDGQLTHLCGLIGSVARNKGATVSYMGIPGTDNVIALINSHLPFDADSVKVSMAKFNAMIRQNALFNSDICFNNIFEELVLKQREKGMNISHVIFMGDLNYRLWTGNIPATVVGQMIIGDPHSKELYERLYREYDELRQQKEKRNIYYMEEGINDEGPRFAPTCKMRIERNMACDLDPYRQSLPDKPSDCWTLGKQDQRVPSWCDRVLYSKLDANSDLNLMCRAYERFDIGDTMKKSDHAGVMAVFDLVQ